MTSIPETAEHHDEELPKSNNSNSNNNSNNNDDDDDDDDDDGEEEKEETALATTSKTAMNRGDRRRRRRLFAGRFVFVVLTAVLIGLYTWFVVHAGERNSIYQTLDSVLEHAEEVLHETMVRSSL